MNEVLAKNQINCASNRQQKKVAFECLKCKVELTNNLYNQLVASLAPEAFSESVAVLVHSLNVNWEYFVNVNDNSKNAYRRAITNTCVSVMT
ncbi:CLUMA_CG003939, isoform A [Clunio marinus]|uniref:CLUMA_CG003939, isoform A n=1 Tax=Clunio marinus TaxID=568069 RepID=A0A1J1HRS3_9DIPT|nr:CLUMA_CG003939, isoform A [Clunio marinus]